MPNGRGTLIFQGVRYEGEVRDGKPNGIGTLTNARRHLARHLEGRVPAGQAEGRVRRSAVGLLKFVYRSKLKEILK